MPNNSKIRVMHLASPTALYGAERWILALTRHLDSSKIDSIIASIKDAPELEAPVCHMAARAGFRTHIFEIMGKFNISAIREVKTYIQEKNVHILHSHGYKSDTIGRFATIGTKCKLLTTPHGWSETAGLKLQLYEILDRLIFPFFHAVVPLSQELYSGLEGIPGLKNKLHLIPNGVDLSEIDSVKAPADEIQKLKEEGYLILGYIGQLINRKGIDLLLESFSELTESKIKLFIVGDGPLLTELQSLSSHLGVLDRTVFTGFRQDRLALMKGFDVFVLPSKLEGIPRCVLEAMALGVPVVASNIPGCRDVVKHERTGLLFHSNQSYSLLNQLRMILSNPDMALELTQNARRFVEEQFSALRMAQHYTNLYSSLVS